MHEISIVVSFFFCCKNAVISIFKTAIKFFFIIVTKTNKKFAVNLKFQLTDEVGNFDQARANCRALGGDLVTENLGPGGSHYHE